MQYLQAVQNEGKLDVIDVILLAPHGDETGRFCFEKVNKEFLSELRVE